jgi:uncharacterized membrane protein YfcA|tara:strand:+ start:4710 stop:5495 length:786 start_codon:yes stop_codon:yes gene_type:complete
MTFLVYLLVGSAAGLLAGLFGIGGGLVIVPVLIITFGLMGISDQVLTHMALATSLTTIIFTSLSSVKEHHAHGAVDWLLVRWIGAGIIMGTAIGVFLLADVAGETLQIAIGIFALLMAAKMAFDLNPGSTRQVPGKTGLIASGSIIGFGSAWFGIGGGSFTVPFLTWVNVPMKRAVATAAACGLPIAMTGAVSNVYTGWGHTELPEWTTGFVYWPAVLGIALTSVPCAKIGAKLAHKLDAKLLKRGFALLLLIVGLKFLFV